MSHAIDDETRTKMMTALTFDLERCKPQIEGIINTRKQIAKEYLKYPSSTHSDEVLKMLFEEHNNLLKQIIGM